MTTHFDDPVKDEIWQIMRALNVAWTKGNPDDLRKYFHQDMVAITPMDRGRLEGRDACVTSWTNFANAATIHYWKELDAKIQVYGQTAVVTYYYDTSFDMGGKTVTLQGRDMFVFVKEDGRWWAVADQFSRQPGE